MTVSRPPCARGAWRRLPGLLSCSHDRPGVALDLLDVGVAQVDGRDPQWHRVEQAGVESDDEVALRVQAEEEGGVHSGDVVGDAVVLARPGLLGAVAQLPADLVGGPVPGQPSGDANGVDEEADPLAGVELDPDVDRRAGRLAGVQHGPAACLHRVPEEVVQIGSALNSVDERDVTSSDKGDALACFAAGHA